MNQPRSALRGAASRLFAGALALSLVSVFAQTAPDADKEKKDDALKLDAFAVTGSRIRRVDAETPQPVVRLTSEDFKATGFSTVGDAIRAMPEISGQSLVSTDAGTSFTPGISSFNLRGLGGNNTLLLINGRRLAPFASPGFNGFQTLFDLDSMPTSAIESIEVLKDGASAVYGSDAVAGVVNITLRKAYSGFTSEVSVGNTLHTDTAERSAFVIFGAQAGKASIVATLNYYHREGAMARDLSYTAQSDGRAYGGIDSRSTAGPIGLVIGLPRTTQFPGGVATFNTPQTNPTLAAASPDPNFYNFQESAGFLARYSNFGFFTRASYEFNDNVTGYIEASIGRKNVKVDAAPTPLFATNELGNSPSGSLMFPATNPYNPFGVNITDLRWRMMELGNRVQDVLVTSPRIVAGLEGKLPWEGWTYDAGLLFSRNEVNNFSRNYTSDALVQNAFNGVTLNRVVQYLNPFGPNTPEMLNYLRINNPNVDLFEVNSADVSVNGPLFHLPAGDLGVAVGAEMRSERLESLGTLLNREGQIVGGSTGSDIIGNRRLYSYYAELSIPVLAKTSPIGSIEMQAAGRREEYSDFGTTTKPKVAAVWRPLPELLLRGSYGESFLAPNLPYLYLDRSVSFSSGVIADPLRPNDQSRQIQQFGGGNRNLQPEETKVNYYGLVAQPFVRRGPKLLRDFSFGVEYYKFKQRNLIASLTAGQILNNTAAFGNLVLRNAPAPGETVGTILAVLTNYQNLSYATYEGYDFNVRWSLPRYSWGQLRMNASATYIAERSNIGATGVYTEFGGDYSTPLVRGNTSLTWSKGDWTASIYGSYIGHYTMQGSGISNAATRPDAKAQWVWSPQVAYRGFAKSTITVGIRNVFDKAPPVSVGDSSLVNENVNYVEPLFWYVRWGRDW